MPHMGIPLACKTHKAAIVSFALPVAVESDHLTC